MKGHDVYFVQEEEEEEEEYVFKQKREDNATGGKCVRAREGAFAEASGSILPK